MTRAEMDAAIRAAMEKAGWHANFIVSKTECIAFIAGMRAAADAVFVAPPGSLYDREHCRDFIRADADELEQTK